MLLRRATLACLALIMLAGPTEARAEPVTPQLQPASIQLRTSSRLDSNVLREDQTAQLRQLQRMETLRTVGRALTWTGVAAGGTGTLLAGIGLIGFYGGVFSLNFGSMSAGAVVFESGVILAGCGLLAMAVGIPLWAVYAYRIDRLKLQLRPMPMVWYDGTRSAGGLAWSVTF